jgi:hypothetical protein
MKHGGKLLVCLGGLAICAAAKGVPAVSSETSDNPYQSIVDRNVFSLKPAPAAVDPAEANNKPQTLKITLTGITTILGNKRVLMKTAPPPGKPGEGPKTEVSYILTEGQREGDIEVMEIDDKAGSVKVNNGGTVQTLTFEKDGAKLPATQPPPAAVAPGGAPVPGLPVARPLPQAPGAGGTTPNFQLPSRVPRLPVPGQVTPSAQGGLGAAFSPNVGTPAYGNPGYTPGYLPGNTTTPTVPGGVLPTPTPVSSASPEEQAIMIEANRQLGGPSAAFLPPTPLNPHANVADPGQTPQVPGVTLPVPGRTATGQY